MPRNIVLQFSADLELPKSIVINAQGEKALKLIIESLMAQGLAYLPPKVEENVSIDDPDLQTVNIVYKDMYGERMSSLASGSLVVVNPEVAPVFDALLESATIIPSEGFQSPDVSQDHNQTIRLTVGEGIKDPVAGRVFDRYFKALQQQDYEALIDVYDPDVVIYSVVDETGRSVCIKGRNNVIANQRARWNYWIETYGPLMHEFITTHVDTYTAMMRFYLTNAEIVFGSIYTMSGYRITSVRHVRETFDVPTHIGAPDLMRWAGNISPASND